MLLLRHGRTSANADGSLAGRAAVALDETGQAQARAAGDRLRDLPLRLLASSPLVRCWQTVGLALPGREILPEEGLVECGYGEWEGQQLKRLARQPLWRPSNSIRPG